MNVVQHVTGGVVALAWAGHCHTVGRVWAAVLGWVQLPAELTADGEREVGLLLSRLSLQMQKTKHHTDNHRSINQSIKSTTAVSSNSFSYHTTFFPSFITDTNAKSTAWLYQLNKVETIISLSLCSIDVSQDELLLTIQWTPFLGLQVKEAGFL